MYEKTISLDIDGVLANFTRGFTRIAHELFATPVGDGQSQETWFFEDNPQLGLTKEMCDFTNGPIWNTVRRSPTFWADLDPFNVSVMDRINRIKNKIFITNRLGVNPLEQSVDFLERWGIKNPTVLIAAKKAPVAAEYHVVAHLDDYYPNCVEIKQVLPARYIALHYAPYNITFHNEWRTQHNGEITLSVDHFLNECEARDYVEY